MKTRFSLVSNSSSSSFVIKKADISYEALKELVNDTCYGILNDDAEWVADMTVDDGDDYVSQAKVDQYYYISTQTGGDDYSQSHFKLLKYFVDHKITDHVNTIYYRGDGRYDVDQEQLALTNGEFLD